MGRNVPTIHITNLGLSQGPSRKRPHFSPSSSPGPPPKRCRVSHAPVSPAPTSDRIETLEREVKSLTTRLATVEILIDALQRDDIGRDVKETGLEARVKRLEDAMQRDR
ncbi:hypothetical protein Tco_0153160 [Tanacetum coccineum]